MNRPLRFGGQAVIEGVMMRGPNVMTVAVRAPSQNIVVTLKELKGWMTKGRRIPLLRGVLALIEAVWLGIYALLLSANQATGEEEKLSTLDMVVIVGLAIVVAVGVFFIGPTVVIGFTSGRTPVIMNLLEGFFRLGLLVAYIWGVSFVKDIHRVLQYHGAEHKAINAYEAGEELNVANVQRYSRVHKRCGTSFLLVVALVSILLFSVLGWPNLVWRILARVVLIPAVAGLSYEVIMLGSSSSSPLANLLATPGMWLQRFTTREPDASQIEVAVAAIKGVMEYVGEA